MPLGPNTKSNVGIRRVVASLTPPQERCFEVNGTQVYVVMSAQSYSHAGNSYTKGASIPYDAAAGTKYSNAARLERDFVRGVLDPVD
jgi:hypothetical protein